MPIKKHHIKLTEKERSDLTNISRKKNAAHNKVQKSKAMLAMDCGEHGPSQTDVEASRLSGLSTRSLESLRKRVCEVGPFGALERKPRKSPPVAPKVTGEVEARMVQIACSQPQEGQSRWTMRLIAEKLIELEVVDSISDETVRLWLKKTTLNRGDKSVGASLQSKMPLL